MSRLDFTEFSDDKKIKKRKRHDNDTNNDTNIIDNDTIIHQSNSLDNNNNNDEYQMKLVIPQTFTKQIKKIFENNSVFPYITLLFNQSGWRIISKNETDSLYLLAEIPSKFFTYYYIANNKIRITLDIIRLHKLFNAADKYEILSLSIKNNNAIIFVEMISKKHTLETKRQSCLTGMEVAQIKSIPNSKIYNYMMEFEATHFCDIISDFNNHSHGNGSNEIIIATDYHSVVFLVHEDGDEPIILTLSPKNRIPKIEENKDENTFYCAKFLIKYLVIVAKTKIKTDSIYLHFHGGDSPLLIRYIIDLPSNNNNNSDSGVLKFFIGELFPDDKFLEDKALCFKELNKLN